MDSTATVPSAPDARKALTKVAFGIGALMSIYQIFASVTGAMQSLPFRAGHLAFALCLVFLWRIIKRTEPFGVRDVIDLVCAIVGICINIYVMADYENQLLDIAFPSDMQLIIGAISILLVLYGTYAAMGIAIPLVAGFFLFYALLGEYIPFIEAEGYPLWRVIGYLSMGMEGIYGPVLGVSANYIFLFVLFGAFLERSGASNFFIQVSLACFGRAKGGPAKAGVIASGLFGMISGSAVANIMAVGPLTLPLMTRLGFPKNFSGGMLSVAGTGGQLMPPVMGSAAFIVAETLQVSYLEVCKAAFIPAVLYYMSLWFIINCRSYRMNVARLPEKEIPNLWEVVRKGFYMGFPVIVLIVCLAVLDMSPMRASLWAIFALILVASIKKETRFTVKSFMEALAAGAKSSLLVAVLCATAGIIIGLLNMTGLGLQISQMLITLSFGWQPLLLVLTAICGLILGMGMTATSVYIILAVLVAPALVEMGVPIMAAHLFAFHFGILSAITPPVAIASYAAASLTETSPTKVGYEGFRIGAAGFIIPFMFLYNPVLMMQGAWYNVLYSFITASVGVYCIACSLEGWMGARINLLLRAVLFLAAFLLIDSGLVTDILGVGLMVVTFFAVKIMKAKGLITVEADRTLDEETDAGMAAGPIHARYMND